VVFTLWGAGVEEVHQVPNQPGSAVVVVCSIQVEIPERCLGGWWCTFMAAGSAVIAAVSG
jgi:hypothetical protein